MRTLYHFPLCPFSRKTRVTLAEKKLDYELVVENYWERRREFARLNPAMQVPVLVEPDNKILPDSYAICEYLDTVYPEHRLIGYTETEAAEIRRLVSWFDNKFFQEVNKYLIHEKVLRYYTRVGAPHSEAIRVAKANIIPHMEYISYLTDENMWLTGERITLADITAASHISIADYLGGVPWDGYPRVKEWYALIKSRPSFRKILNDKIPGFAPPKHYALLDF
jgi:glutathione S-transferase